MNTGATTPATLPITSSTATTIRAFRAILLFRYARRTSTYSPGGRCIVSRVTI